MVFYRKTLTEKGEKMTDKIQQSQPTVDELYQNIAAEMVSVISTDNWAEAVLHINIQEAYIHYNGEYTDIEGRTYPLQVHKFSYEIDTYIEELYSLMSEGESRWNKADFILKEDGSFSMNLDWQDDAESEG